MRITGNAKHGIAVEGTTTVNSGTITILDTDSDGIHGSSNLIWNGGNLDIIEAGKVKQGTWTVMRTVDAVTGHDGRYFDSVTAGYKVKYNVEVVEDGTTYYEIQVTKKQSGFSVKFR